MGVVGKWDSRHSRSETHQVLGKNHLWFRTEAAAKRYQEDRNIKARARTAGFSTDEEGLDAFRVYETRLKKKPLTAKKKVEKIRRLMGREDLTMGQFGTAVINIIEDR
jgi:hypothetical protein